MRAESSATAPPKFGPIVSSTKVVPLAKTKKRCAQLATTSSSISNRLRTGNDFGLRADGRYYPYSTPQGRRISARQVVWDKALYASGCTPDEARERLCADLNQTLTELKSALVDRKPAVDFNRLELRLQECLLDFAHTEGPAALPEEFLAAGSPMIGRRSFAITAMFATPGHAPDHPRNKAFAERWVYPQLGSSGEKQ